jgi:murein DD-endopeptidase MepM/ murein hydrolase activator NlpD
VVRPGDTLTGIAAIYSIDVDRLVLANDLHDADRIRVGQTLQIPARFEATYPEALVEAAARAYRNARFELAIERAERAQEMLEREPEDERGRALSARAAFIAGCATAAFGDDERTVAAFARVRALDPGFTPPTGWLSPRLEKLYLAAQAD